jgi:hypothetical protein
MKRRIPLLLSAALPLILVSIASACPMCKDSIPNSDAASAGGLPSGFNNSVYLMLVTFLGTLGLISGVLWKGVRSTNVTPKARGFDVTPKK